MLTILFRIELVNTHNGESRDRASKEVRVSVRLTPPHHGGSWTEILHTNLSDERQTLDPLPLHEFFTPPTLGRFVKFSVLSAHGLGGGLQYFRAFTGNFLKLLHCFKLEQGNKESCEENRVLISNLDFVKTMELKLLFLYVFSISSGPENKELSEWSEWSQWKPCENVIMGGCAGRNETHVR